MLLFDNEANGKVISILKVSEIKGTYISILDRPVVKRQRQRSDWRYLTKDLEAYSKGYDEEEAILEAEEKAMIKTVIKKKAEAERKNMM